MVLESVCHPRGHNGAGGGPALSSMLGLSMCTRVPHACRGQRSVDPLELGLQTVAGHHVGAGK